MKKIIMAPLLATSLLLTSCGSKTDFTGAAQEVRFITLNPGHFHAALVQKSMYPQVHPTVHIYAPNGPDAGLHKQRVDAFNARTDDPTGWESVTYLGEDYLERMLAERKGNVVVIAGNNRKKTEYIKKSVSAGLNVLSDKPMAIDSSSFQVLRDAFAEAQKQGVLLYDIMTERYEITSLLQRELAQMPELFGTLETGSPENPSVVKESVHHFFKYVSGSVLRRPPWYFDIDQQGEGIVDVTTHLVDLIQWVCFPDVVLNYSTDVEVYSARRWPTPISREQFTSITGLNHFPAYLSKDMGADSTLQIYANGEMQYSLKGVNARISVEWNFEAPAGGGDTHYSLMRGTRSGLIIRQGAEEGYVPTLHIVPAQGASTPQWQQEVNNAFGHISAKYPGMILEKTGDGFVVRIPEQYRVGHEARFSQVTQKYLQFLVDGALPEWEVPNMLAKYYTTTRALELARGSK